MSDLHILRRRLALPITTLTLLLAAAPLMAQGPTDGTATSDAAQAAPVPLSALTIDNALAAGQDGNLDLLTARLAVQTAKANLRSADTAPNPTFSVNALQIRPSQVGNLPYGQLVDTIARIDMPLERGGKRRARTGSARASIAAAEGDLADTQRQIRVAINDAYYDLKAAEARSALLRSIADTYGETQRIAQRQQRGGAISVGDLARQKVEALKATSEAAKADTDRREAQLALATLIGREAEAGTIVTASDWPLPAGSSADAVDTLAERRPDVLAAEARLDAARRNLDGAHALRHPDVTVGLQYEKAGGDVGVGDSVGVGLSVPLPIRNRYNGEVDAASTAVVQAEAQARKALAVAKAEIVIARQAAQEASERRQAFDESQLPAARKAASVAEFAYSRGAMALLDLLDARRSLRAIELGAIDAHVDEAQALSRLRAAETTGDN